MTTAEAVETSVTTINSLSQDFTNLDDQPSQTLTVLWILMQIQEVSILIDYDIVTGQYCLKNTFRYDIIIRYPVSYTFVKIFSCISNICQKIVYIYLFLIGECCARHFLKGTGGLHSM